MNKIYLVADCIFENPNRQAGRQRLTPFDWRYKEKNVSASILIRIIAGSIKFDAKDCIQMTIPTK